MPDFMLFGPFKGRRRLKEDMQDFYKGQAQQSNILLSKTRN